jgi:hypothetical protein
VLQEKHRQICEYWILSLLASLAFLCTIAPKAHGQSPSQMENVKTPAKVEHHKTVVTEESSSIYYTTRIVKIPNASKYAPARKSLMHEQAPKMVPRKQIPLLTAEIKVVSDNNDVAVTSGLNQSADRLVNSSTLEPVKTRGISGSLFRRWVNNRRTNRPEANWQVLVLKGKWDHAEKVLQASGIPHLVLSPDKFIDKLPQAKIVIVNCPGEMSDLSLQMLQNFVNKGGYLLTTDWSLSNCIQPLFHQIVTWDGSYTTSEIVDAVAVEPDNNLFKEAVNKAPWKLDDKSEMAKIVNRSKAGVLVRSRILSEQDPNKLGVLALTFSYGKGRVLHLVGHFNNNASLASQAALPDPAPRIQISLRQALALNFVLEGLSVLDTK